MTPKEELLQYIVKEYAAAVSDQKKIRLKLDNLEVNEDNLVPRSDLIKEKFFLLGRASMINDFYAYLNQTSY